MTTKKIGVVPMTGYCTITAYADHILKNKEL
jgi:hypothetical protein